MFPDAGGIFNTQSAVGGIDGHPGEAEFFKFPCQGTECRCPEAPFRIIVIAGQQMQRDRGSTQNLTAQFILCLCPFIGDITGHHGKLCAQSGGIFQCFPHQKSGLNEITAFAVFCFQRHMGIADQSKTAQFLSPGRFECGKFKFNT